MVFCDVFLLLRCLVVFCCTFVCFTETTARAAGIARPPGTAARKVEKTVLKEAKETQEVGRYGGVTARVAFSFGFGFGFCCFLPCFFVILCFFGGFVFSGESASVPPRAAKGCGERLAKKNSGSRTKETKEVGARSGAVTTRVAFWFCFLFFSSFFILCFLVVSFFQQNEQEQQDQHQEQQKMLLKDKVKHKQKGQWSKKQKKLVVTVVQ